MTEKYAANRNQASQMSFAALLSLVLTIANSDSSKKLELITPKSLVVNDHVLVRKESRKAGVVGKLYAVTEFVIDYQNSKLIRLSEYPNRIDDLTANTVFEFDNSGNLISQRDIDDRGTASINQFVYDSDGQLTNLNGFMAPMEIQVPRGSTAIYRTAILREKWRRAESFTQRLLAISGPIPAQSTVVSYTR